MLNDNHVIARKRSYLVRHEMVSQMASVHWLHRHGLITQADTKNQHPYHQLNRKSKQPVHFCSIYKSVVNNSNKYRFNRNRLTIIYTRMRNSLDKSTARNRMMKLTSIKSIVEQITP